MIVCNNNNQGDGEALQVDRGGRTEGGEGGKRGEEGGGGEILACGQAGRRPTKGSTRGPRGPKNLSIFCV